MTDKSINILSEFLRAAGLTRPDEEPINFWDDKNYDLLCCLADALIHDYPNSRFVGIGNSASYPVWAIERIAHFSGTDVQTAYIPFSDRFVEPLSATKDMCTFHSCAETGRYKNIHKAMIKNRCAYRETLTQLGMHPYKILGEFQKTGLKTVILDNVQGGSSFFSFICFMYEWAADTQIKKEIFSRALTPVGLSSFSMPDKFILLGSQQKPFAVDIDIIPPMPILLRRALNGNYSLDTDRFVPHYPPKAWGKPPLAVPAENQKKIKEIKDGIDRRAAHFAAALWTPMLLAAPKCEI